MRRIPPAAMMASPSPADIADLRHRLKLTQAQAAALALVATRTWIKYESGERRMWAPVWALFRLRARLIALADLD